MADQAAGLLSPWLRRRRIRAAASFIRGSVLDVGCGIGALADIVPAERYIGVDHDAESLADARRAHPRHTFVDTLPGGRFDTVIALAVIEHVTDPKAFVAELATRSAPGGSLILTTPHPRGERIHEFAARLRLASREAHDDHESLLDLEALRELVAANGFATSTARPFLLGLNQLLVALDREHYERE